MVLHLTESGVHHPRLTVFIHGGGCQRLVAVQQISYFQHFGGSAMEYSLAESMLFNKTLDV
ncbi:hypothetical protein ABZM97_14485 [Bacillus vallismortis]|uniref:hypothetical protein n=1 Tax=Bacillus vallismortis TaxID=72361 RepID=UPI00345FB928